MLYEDIDNLIGNTPLVKFNEYNNNLYLKLEKYSLNGSIKDRAAYYIINELINKNKVQENDLLICSTSGNLGISLAYFCKKYKLRLIIVMPSNVSIERIKLINSLGGRVYLVDSSDFNILNDISIKLSKRLNGHFIDQFNNEQSVLAGYYLGKELSEEIDNIDYVFCGIGSGGTFQGLTNYYKNRKTLVYGILPKKEKHLITGIGPGFISKNIKDLKNIIYVDDIKSLNKQKKFIKRFGILIGKSSGAVLEGCKSIIDKNNLRNKNIILIFPDSFERYLSE